jgi:hypothetical protein
MFKYFLTAILSCTQNLKYQLVYLVKIDSLLEFLTQVLDYKYVFGF